VLRGENLTGELRGGEVGGGDGPTTGVLLADMRERGPLVEGGTGQRCARASGGENTEMVKKKNKQGPPQEIQPEVGQTGKER